VPLMDVPDVPPHEADGGGRPGKAGTRGRRRKERAIGLCRGVDYSKPGHERMDFLSPGLAADQYFVAYEKRPWDPWKKPSSDVELIVPPKHGKLEFVSHKDGGVLPAYTPVPEYVGDERIVFRVKVEGTTVRVIYLLKVTKRFADEAGVHEDLCRKTGNQWKISVADEPDHPPSSRSA